MQLTALLSQLGALSIAFLVLAAAPLPLRGQAAPENPPPSSANPEEFNQAELLKAYLQVREQLHTAQLTMVNNRVEAATEKLESLRKAMEVERDRQRAELERAAVAAERQKAETERSNRATIWAAAAFGTAGLLAMLMVPIVQARAMKRMAHLVSSPSTQLVAAAPAELMASGIAAADQNVTNTTQRLLSVVERMERRIKELETTATPPPATVTAGAASTANAIRLSPTVDSPRRNAAEDRAMWITVLMNKAQTLLHANKTQEAVACYDEILGFDANHAHALVKRGAALERLNRFEEALECYDLAIEADDRMTLAHLSRGGICNRLGRHSEAIASYERALQVEAKSA